uniref:Uncharacterized protein n=1 Tax=Globisporangium ultimum (strain ATCC 200006 / CBS 805.95 / DAOM BR144) TaxID=431595 RepID=K3W779_GLOUD
MPHGALSVTNSRACWLLLAAYVVAAIHPTVEAIALGQAQAVANGESASSNGACLVQVSSGDAAVGVNVITDWSCANGGGLGCFDTNCRYCKTTDTPQSKNWRSCDELLFQSRGSDVVASSSTPAPTAGASPAAVTATTSAAVDTCAYVVSPDDSAGGIAVVTDASCRNGGLGCLENVCRLCKTVSTGMSAHLLDCNRVFAVGSTNAPGTATAAAPVASTPTPSTSTPAAASLGLVLPLAPQADDMDNQELFETPPTNYCSAYLIGRDQAAAGVWAYVDGDGCAANPSRCVLSVCRLCKFAVSPSSTQYEICPSLSIFTARRD